MLLVFPQHLIAQNQSFVQKEVGQNIYSFKRTSIPLFVGVDAHIDTFSFIFLLM